MEAIINIHNTDFSHEYTVGDDIIHYNNFNIKYKLTTNNNYDILPLDHISMHIIRIYNINNHNINININNNINNININSVKQFIKSLNKIYNNYMSFCTVCGKTTKNKTLESIDICNNNDCIIKSYNLPTSNLIYKILIEEPEKLIFLTQLLISGTKHKYASESYTPIPKILNCSTVNDIITDLATANINFDFTKFENCSNEYELFKLCNLNEYAYYKNAILNNYFSMSHSNIVDNNNIDIFNINYDAEKENSVQNLDSSYLFHGSSIDCWYSIVKNGLKIMSGTKFQTNGAAYGNGIYFSDSFNFSSSYSSRGFIHDKTATNINIKVISVFQIFDDISKIKKTTNIFVVTDTNTIMLRALIVLKNNYNPTNLESSTINSHFSLHMGLLKKKTNVSIKLIKLKRLNKEYTNLLKCNNFKIDVSDDINDNVIWNINLLNINKNLCPKLDVKIIFNNYPIIAPIAYVQNHTFIGNNLIVDNKINIPILNPIVWSIHNNMETILSQIENLFK